MTQKIKTLKLIHVAICAGMIVAYIFAGQFTIEQLKGQAIGTDDLVYLAIPIAAFLLSNFLFRARLKQVDPRLRIEEKLPDYQTASLIRWAILEGGAFFNTVYETGSLDFWNTTNFVSDLLKTDGAKNGE